MTIFGSLCDQIRWILWPGQVFFFLGSSKPQNVTSSRENLSPRFAITTRQWLSHWGGIKLAQVTRLKCLVTRLAQMTSHWGRIKLARVTSFNCFVTILTQVTRLRHYVTRLKCLVTRFFLCDQFEHFLKNSYLSYNFSLAHIEGPLRGIWLRQGCGVCRCVFGVN